MQGLNEVPVDRVSTLMQQQPSLELSEELQEKVYFFREEQERQHLQAVQGDQTRARQQLAETLHACAPARDSDDSSSSSSDSEDEKEHLLGKRTAPQRDCS